MSAPAANSIPLVDLKAQFASIGNELKEATVKALYVRKPDGSSLSFG